MASVAHLEQDLREESSSKGRLLNNLQRNSLLLATERKSFQQMKSDVARLRHNMETGNRDAERIAGPRLAGKQHGSGDANQSAPWRSLTKFVLAG